MNAPEVPEIKPDERTEKTLTNLFSLASAIVTGKKISPERMRQRLAVCMECDRMRSDGSNWRCGVCGCKLDAPDAVNDQLKSRLINLVLYEETARYGCKHGTGSRWKKAGI